MITIGIDTGGTFTDFVYVDENGSIGTYKVLSTPGNPAEAVINGIQKIACNRQKFIVHGSTVATNAILERKGVKCALITNKGFEDVIAIGRQTREKLYDLSYEKQDFFLSESLRFGIKGRVNFAGEILEDIDEEEIKRVIKKIQEAHVESVAVSLLFSFANPTHEQTIGKMLNEFGINYSLSHKILPEFREFERTSTTVLNAYVSPIMKKYISELRSKLFLNDSLRVMQSNGGSISVEVAMNESVRTILSGPAGGVVGAFEIGKVAGFDKLITFDMGGTSTDVSLINGKLPITTESKIAGFPVRVSMVDLHTVGAGGGSIAYIDEGGSLRVGPNSAGADPGPICYGKGKRITVTDANLYLGRLLPDRFLGGSMKLASERLEPYFKNFAHKLSMNPVSLSEGILDVANATMERAIRVISVERGFDVRDFTLFSFGGAGAMHALFLAKSLNIPRVMIPVNPGLLSAVGMLLADIIKDYSLTVMLRSGKTNFEALQNLFKPLIEKGRKDLREEGVGEKDMIFKYYLDMRYRGQSHEITVLFSDNYIEEFHYAHKKHFGYSNQDKETEVVNIRLRVHGLLKKPQLKKFSKKTTSSGKYARVSDTQAIFNSRKLKTTVYDRNLLHPGNVIDGPAIITEYSSTVILPPFTRLEVDNYLNLIVEIGD